MDWPAGETAFVTGAASGIGLGIARALLGAGVKVALAGIDHRRLAEVAEDLAGAGGAVMAVPLDVSDPGSWTRAADRAEDALGPVSILCNSAGVTGSGPGGETSLDAWRWLHRLTVETQFLGVATFLARFSSRGGRAHIVTTAGRAPLAGVDDCAAAPNLAGVRFALALRHEVAGTGIGFSVLCPGSADDPDHVGEQVLRAMRERQTFVLGPPPPHGWEQAAAECASGAWAELVDGLLVSGARRI
ncbi:hypothetical protein GCM10017786_06650 [Amycolatopsis deserti]|uniref:Uncharacterized protein n=1 Tax=Amycolatopsis deserti TaxID=185696 RepID=A0ABQ3IFN8_9PSEU|nr:SDR family oxidoreductase [Amycolatopsis deserti]GHE79448.1 hypothetical protein GCM10017786_06650 [Amycolatopsis deserti]